ncbi:21492_t:CDS:1, partial [Dentiscutata erythropus]
VLTNTFNYTASNATSNVQQEIVKSSLLFGCFMMLGRFGFFTYT